jgi:SAM-dependent methyltransferase
MLHEFLAHPLTKGLDIDDPRTTHLRRRIIQEKAFLRKIYEEWYRSIAASLPAGHGAVLELGSGAGFMRDFVPDLITSELFYCPDIRVTLSGLSLPFRASSLRGIVMTDVLHHLPQPRLFFGEAARCVRPGGVIAMVEPWVSPWSRFVYRWLHHEPFDPETALWELPKSGPLSGANGALGWVIFTRDRIRFEQEFPQWRVELIRPFMPFRYLVSGGVSLRALAPGWSFGVFHAIESALERWHSLSAMFAHVVLRRLDHGWEPISRGLS